MKYITLITFILIVSVSSGYGEMYRWVDEKGTVHFTDDLSKIPERYRPDAEERKDSKGISPSLPEIKEKSAPTPVTKAPEPEGFEVDLLRRYELLLAEVVLNSTVKRYFVVDSGASFTLINKETARELGLSIDENTPFLPVTTVSDVILTPLVTLKSVQVGNAEVENVEALIYNMPNYQGLLGNTFLNKFRVVLDSINTKMTLFPMKGVPSPDRPGGYGRDYWVGQFRFYHRNLAELKKLKTKYESQGGRSEVNRVNNAIRFFEDQLSELERKASFAGVPRNWRE
jgi:clan AA aspartic protease (TIGR02281 family)